MRKQVDDSPGRGSQFSGQSPLKQVAQRAPPAAATDDPWPVRRRNPVDRIERCEQTALTTLIGARRAGKRDELAAVEKGCLDDSPAIAAGADEFSSVKNLHQSNEVVIAKNATSRRSRRLREITRQSACLMGLSIREVAPTDL
jgi:hypothetical protein